MRVRPTSFRTPAPIGSFWADRSLASLSLGGCTRGTGGDDGTVSGVAPLGTASSGVVSGGSSVAGSFPSAN